jgi:hypothetical protein
MSMNENSPLHERGGVEGGDALQALRGSIFLPQDLS